MLEAKIRESSPIKGAVIWLHGLGASADDLMGLLAVPSLGALPLRHIFLNAPVRAVTLNAGMAMRAWYDIQGLTAHAREDAAGIQQSRGAIREVITAQLASGLQSEQIFLAGFSQGGAMALDVGLHDPYRLGGILAMSAYLPNQAGCQAHQPKDVPIMMTYGREDAVVLPAWTEASRDWLTQQGYHAVTVQSYVGGHTISMPMIQDMVQWFALRGVTINANG